MPIPKPALEVLIKDASIRDRATARRTALLEILLQERYLTREQLIVRVEGKLGNGCFGDSAWEDTFYRDIRLVKQALRAAGYRPAYSRSLQNHGYYLSGQPHISPELSTRLDGSIAEIDPAQIAVFKKLSFRERFQEGCSISNLAHKAVAYRIHQRKPGLSLSEAHRLAIQKKASS